MYVVVCIGGCLYVIVCAGERFYHVALTVLPLSLLFNDSALSNRFGVYQRCDNLFLSLLYSVFKGKKAQKSHLSFIIFIGTQCVDNGNRYHFRNVGHHSVH